MKPRSEPYLRSQEVADVLGITKRTLMNWLRTQKIPEPERNQANQYRRWSTQDVERIRQIIAENQPVIRLVISNQRGGVAKTTTATTLARLWADRGRKVLLIDTDPARVRGHVSGSEGRQVPAPLCSL